MTGDWARPTDGDRPTSAPTGEVIEITLDGPDHLDRSPDGHPAPDGLDRPQEPSIRKVVGGASILGVVIGVAIVVTMSVGGDDEPVDPAVTTLAPGEASSIITTPPTLPPVGAVDGGFAGEVANEADPVAPAIPAYPSVAGDDPGAEFPLELPVPPLDRPVVATITISRFGDTFGGPAVYDPVNDRVRVELGAGTVSQVLLVDLSTDVVLLSVSDSEAPEEEQRWQRMSDDIFGPAGEFGVRDYLDALLLGPVRADNIDRATTVETGGRVLLDESTVARRRVVTLPAEAVPEWQWLYGATGDDPDDSLQFEVYVSEDGATYVTQGVNTVGDEPIATVHRVRVGDGLAGPIDWPPDDLIDELPAFDATPEGPDLDSLRPVYEEVAADPADFDLDAALDRLRSAPAPISTIWDRGPRGVNEIVIRRDEANDRLALTRRVVEVVDDAEPFAGYFAQIDDRTTGTGWLRRGEDDPWVSAPLGNGIQPLDARWEVGLVTADELAAAQRTGTGSNPVLLDNGVVAKPFTLLLPSATIQWERPLVGGISTSEPLDVTVFVGDDGSIHEIQVVANQGQPRLFQQRYDHGQPAITIDLP